MGLGHRGPHSFALRPGGTVPAVLFVSQTMIKRCPRPHSISRAFVCNFHPPARANPRPSFCPYIPKRGFFYHSRLSLSSSLSPLSPPARPFRSFRPLNVLALDDDGPPISPAQDEVPRPSGPARRRRRVCRRQDGRRQQERLPCRLHRHQLPRQRDQEGQITFIHIPRPPGAN